MHWLFIVTGLLFCSAALGFVLTSLCELESRAGLLTLLFACTFAAAWFGLGAALPGITFSVAVAAWTATVIVFIILALPAGKPEPLKNTSLQGRTI